MEEGETYTSLQEFTEDTSTRGNRPILDNNHGSPGRRRGAACLRSPTALFVLFGLLASIGANIVLTVLLFNRPVPDTVLQSAALTLKLNSMLVRHKNLCDDYTNLGQSCSREVKSCRECPGGWLHIGDKCYYFTSDKVDWFKSRDNCTEMGSHLTILHTMEQHEALEKAAKRISGFDYHFWIGLSDIEKEGDWRWVDNTTLQNKFWDRWSSEPDNHLSGGEHGEDCAVLNSHSKSWFDVPCEHIAKGICQMDAILFK